MYCFFIFITATDTPISQLVQLVSRSFDCWEKKKAMKRVVVGTALMGKQTKTKTKKNEKWIHVDSRYVKEIWVQVEVVQNKALVKVWKKDD